MKKLITTCALLTSVSMVSFAQTNQPSSATAAASQTASTPPGAPSAQQNAERRAKMYEQQYKLTPEQYKGVYAAELDFMTKEQKMRAEGGQPGQGQHMQLMMTRDQKFKEIMTPEQYAKYDATRPKMAGMPGAPPQAAAPQPVK